MRTSVTMLVLFAVACGSPEQQTTATSMTTTTVTTTVAKAAPPAAADAKQLIASSPEFSDYQFTNAAFTLAMKRSAMTGPTAASAHDLVQAGWIDIPTDNVALTPKSLHDKRFLVRPNGFLDIVPIAKKEMGDVTAVRPNADNTVSADFNWRWIPNEIGQSFKSGPVRERFDAEQHATAVLNHDSNGWSVSRIDPR
jgi:hypothetical protein